MLEEVLDDLHNWFEQSVVFGTFDATGGTIALPEGFELLDGQYFRIEGSVFSDGLHQWPVSDLADERFEGAVAALAVPRAVQDLADEIAEWCERNPSPGPYVSESFGGYSYSLGTSAASGAPLGWREVFRSRLNRWRKVPGCR